MFEFIGFIVVAIFGWAAFKLILYRIFPEYGLKVATRRFLENPDSHNEKKLAEAQRRVNKRYK